MENYLHTIYEKIDDLIQKQLAFQKNAENEVKIFDGYETENPYFNSIMEIQVEINKYYEIIQQSRDRAFKQICFQQLMYMNATKDGRKSDNMKDYVFLTINPPDSLPRDRLISAVNDFTHLSVVKWAHYVFEQRQITAGDYRGFHAHILFQRDRKPSEVAKAIDRIFLPLVPDRNKLKLWSQDKVEEIYNAYGYITGSKKDKDKQPKQDNDKRMRTDFDLEQIYTVGEPPLLVGGSPVASKKIKLNLIK